MSEKKKLVVVVTSGFNDERSSVAWSVANGAIGSDKQVTMFLVSSGVDWVKKGAADHARLNPLDPPVKDMIQTVVENGGRIFVCPLCAGVRGYEKDDLIDGVTLAGSVAMLSEVQRGTIRSRIRRGKTLLQKALWEQGRDAGFTLPTNNHGHAT